MKPTRREFLRNTCTGAAAGVALLNGYKAFAGTGKAKKPNIVIIYSDDHAYQAISAYGHELGKAAPTKHIDRIAQEGMLFRRSCVTNSICAPCRAAMLTGQHSHINGVKTNTDTLDPKQLTFPGILQKQRYQTAFFGKWHLRADPSGFDSWAILPGQGHYYNPDFITAEGRHKVEGYVTDIIADKALDWLKSKNDSKPYLLMVQNKAPHRNWMPPLKYQGLFKDADLPVPKTLFDDYEGRGTAARKQEMSIMDDMRMGRDLKLMHVMDVDTTRKGTPFGRLTDAQRKAYFGYYAKRNKEFYRKEPSGKELLKWKHRQYMEDYLSCIRSVDDNVGRLLEYLDKSGEAENTIVMYSSDQGFFLGEHGWFDKRFIYKESFRTPLVIKWPGKTKKNNECGDLIQNIDIAPTLLDIAGAEIPQEMQGLSFKDILTGRKDEFERQSVYYHYYEFPKHHHVYPHYGIVSKEYKLAYFYTIDEWELYDLEKDPAEMENKYQNPKYKSIVQRLKSELHGLRKHYQDE